MMCVAALVGLTGCGPSVYEATLLDCLEERPWISDADARACASERSRKCIWASDFDKERLPYDCHA